MCVRFYGLTIDFLLLVVVLYVFLYMKSMRGYEYDLYLGDVEKRIPLWFPFDLRGSISDGVVVGRWRSSEMPEANCSLDPLEFGLVKKCSGDMLAQIRRVQIGTNVIAGICVHKAIPGETHAKVDNKTRNREEEFFVFSTNMTSAVTYAEYSDYRDACLRYGISGDDLLTFEESFRNYVCAKRLPDISTMVRDVLKVGFSKAELKSLVLILVIWWVVAWRIMKLSRP